MAFKDVVIVHEAESKTLVFTAMSLLKSGGKGQHVCFSGLSPMLEYGFKSPFMLEVMGFSTVGVAYNKVGYNEFRI